MMQLFPLELAEHFTTQETQLELLQDAFKSGDSRYIANALGIVARAKNMSALAQETSLSRATLYKALSKDGNPRLTTLLEVMKPLGLKLSVSAA